MAGGGADVPAEDNHRPLKVLSIRKGGWAAPVSIGGINQSFLVDSGACGTILGTNVFAEIGLSDDILEPAEDDFVMADDTPLPVKGQFKSEFHVGDFHGEFTFIVADLGTLPGILGLDFLEHFDVSTRFKYGYMHIEDYKVNLNRMDGFRCSRISYAKGVKIPARTECIIPMDVNKGSGSSLVEGMIEPTFIGAKSGLLVARSLVKIKDGKVPVNIINVHDHAITLPRLKPVAVIKEITGPVTQIENDLPKVDP